MVTVEIPVQWGDMDAFQHVNNVHYLRWFESARIALFERSGLLDRVQAEGIAPILARTEIDYRRPVTFPDTVRVSAHVSTVGRTSFGLACRITSARLGGAVVAEGVTVLVLVRTGTGEKVPLDDGLRAALESLRAP